MAQRITKKNVEARFEACVRMAERVGIKADGWHIWSQYERQWCATTESGEGIFGSGSAFAQGNRQAYDIMEGWLKALQHVNAHQGEAAAFAHAFNKSVPVVPRLNIYAVPEETKRTLDVKS